MTANIQKQGSTPADIGEILVKRGLLRRDQLDYALLEQQTTRHPLGGILERCGFITQHQIANAYAEQWGLEFADVDRIVPNEDALRLFRQNLCSKHQFLPCRIADDTLDIVTSNSDIESLLAVVQRHGGLRVRANMGERGKVNWAIQYFYYFLDNPIEQLLDRQIREASNETQPTLSLDPLITNLFRLAVKRRATDIHVRPTENCLVISFRIDGLLVPAFTLKSSMRRVVSTLKIRAGMDIAEQRLPQDGAFSVSVLDTEYDIRASTTVSPAGENMVLRVLPREGIAAGFEELGFMPEDIEELTETFNHPHGIILLTGPTGSGKTTTLYAGVRAQDVLRKNIITVENPIEYKMPLIRQTEVNTKAGYTFASAIRHFLRHDPDIILVGEIRDAETAQTALTAAETGHLVLSTLHTNDVFGTIPRLQSLGISSFMIADSLVAVVSQRLVRRICLHCREIHQPEGSDARQAERVGARQLFRGRGCAACDGTGYHGRTPIYEILRLRPPLAAAIARDAPLDELRAAAEQGGHRQMVHSVRSKLESGTTSIEEITRVLGIL